MAVSGSYNSKQIAQQIVDDAARICQIIGPDEVLAHNEAHFARRQLDMLIKSWASDSLRLHAIKQTAFNLTAAQNLYKIGATQAAPHVTVQCPDRILQAFRRNTDNVDIPLQLWTREEYWAQPNKELTADAPLALWFRRPQADTYTGTDIYGEIRIWPTPTTSAATEYDIVIVHELPVMDVDTLDDDVEFPGEWHRAIVWNLAADLAYAWGVPYTERSMIQKKAGELHQYALFNNQQEGSLYLAPEPQFRYGR